MKYGYNALKVYSDTVINYVLSSLITICSVSIIVFVVAFWSGILKRGAKAT